MNQHVAKVFIVDDDPVVRESVSAIVESMGIPEQSFSSAEEFLAANCQDQHGCLVCDVRMMGMSGLELQQTLNEMNCPLPMILITAYADVPMAVTAMNNGALTVLEKPYRNHELWDAIRRALDLDLRNRALTQRRRTARKRIESLSPDEQEVLDLIVQGKPNKAIAIELDLSVRTIESRRKQIFTKMQVESLGELIRSFLEAELPESG